MVARRKCEDASGDNARCGSMSGRSVLDGSSWSKSSMMLPLPRGEFFPGNFFPKENTQSTFDFGAILRKYLLVNTHTKLLLVNQHTKLDPQESDSCLFSRFS